MAWLTTLSDDKRIRREHRKDPLWSFTQSGSLTPGSTSGGLTYTQVKVGKRTITTWEYPGISAENADTLVENLEGLENTKEARFQAGEGGGGSIFWTIETRELTS